MTFQLKKKNTNSLDSLIAFFVKANNAKTVTNCIENTIY